MSCSLHPHGTASNKSVRLLSGLTDTASVWSPWTTSHGDTAPPSYPAAPSSPTTPPGRLCPIGLRLNHPLYWGPQARLCAGLRAQMTPRTSEIAVSRAGTQPSLFLPSESCDSKEQTNPLSVTYMSLSKHDSLKYYLVSVSATKM